VKYTPTRQILHRIRETIARDTGKPLSAAGEAEVEITLTSLGGESYPMALGQEFLDQEVTILIADLRGFTALTAAHPATTVVKLLNRCLIEMSEIIARHDGVIDKFMGDSIMVLFGAPVSREDDARRALACAVEMQMAMGALNLAHREHGMPDLFMGIGINTGIVLAGMLGSRRYSEYTVIGNEVNLTSRIEAFSLRGQVLISQSTYERCRDFVTASEPVDIHVKGNTLPLRVHELVAIPSLALKMPRQEIRRSHRVDIKLSLRYQLVQDGIVLPEVHTGVISDMGYHGVQVEVDRLLPLYSEIMLDFELPQVVHQARDIYAKVVAQKSLGRSARLGLEFTSVSRETERQIRLFVQMLIFAAPRL